MTPVAIVTGGSRGIGRAIAQRLAADGMAVVAADVEAPCRTDGVAGVEHVTLDVRDRDAVERTCESVQARLGSLDVLVNNAAVQRLGTIETLEWADWSHVVDVNLHGVFNCLQAAGRRMIRARAGAIVNVTSVLAEVGAPGRAAYTAAKAAVAGLTRVAAVEWAPEGVRVNAVAPGYVETPLLRGAVDARAVDLEATLERIPQGRLAEPGEVAAAVSFLVSAQAGSVTGQTLSVDGGFSARLASNRRH
ncbi:SDR family NAD(P)-dependent oxidoreductase [Capillimicrobium parvum]|uniref:3-oxoacyl-[acyl-carrier-protein] reductase FabG n=1 Tax=Capillimicrobium parvum TaxID=2884022 RepID=A0A9E7BYL6_9ACTN|nr:SDR family oxidoreductase [Capillimicrobium parvum]UGS33657.1 3-oxoacyl-[acyl-carrier-protein] reductase FabG [Capillimicrobium parvum]